MKYLEHRLGGRPSKNPMRLNNRILKKNSEFSWRDVRIDSKVVDRGFVYKITNPRTGRFYIGQTTDFLARIRSHEGSSITNENKLGNPGEWTVKVLELVTFGRFISPRQASQRLIPLETSYIKNYVENPKMINVSKNPLNAKYRSEIKHARDVVDWVFSKKNKKKPKKK